MERKYESLDLIELYILNEFIKEYINSKTMELRNYAGSIDGPSEEVSKLEKILKKRNDVTNEIVKRIEEKLK